jgi:hypothetical protein
MVAGNTVAGWRSVSATTETNHRFDASTRNPLHLLAGANDYRTVDLPGLADDETGDAWLGRLQVVRRRSALDRVRCCRAICRIQRRVGHASTIQGYGAARDPVVRAGTNGLMYYAGLVFDRPEPLTPDIPGKERDLRGALYRQQQQGVRRPLRVSRHARDCKRSRRLDAVTFSTSRGWSLTFPRATTRCTIVTGGEKGPITQSVPAGPVYVAYTAAVDRRKGSATT